MVSVQASGCAPVVKAYESQALTCEFWKDAHTLASGLRVPRSFADRLILQAIYQSNGCAIAVSDEEIIQAQRQLATLEGIFAAPEGAATLAALVNLLESKWIHPDQRIVLFNTGSGLKYL
jgi:threonine synthase